MENSNLLSIINRLMSLNKAVNEAIQATQDNIEIAKAICEHLDEMERLRKIQTISETRKLALDQIRYMN